MKKRKLGMLIIFSLSIGLTGAEWVDFNRGLNQCVKQNKPMVIDFYTDWCHWCQVMEDKTFSEKSVKNYLDEHFVTVRIQAEDSKSRVNFKGNTYTNVEFTRAMGITGFPTMVFMDKNGEPVTRLPGYVPPEEFLSVLKYVHKECYLKQMSFAEFLEKEADCE